MPYYKKSQIRSIGELISHTGERILTPIFIGSMFPIFIKITNFEFEKIKGNKELMKDLSIEKLNLI
jgi:hypothetical protein